MIKCIQASSPNHYCYNEKVFPNISTGQIAPLVISSLNKPPEIALCSTEALGIPPKKLKHGAWSSYFARNIFAAKAQRVQR
jgi:hypothetical protein